MAATSPTATERLLTPREVAAALGVSVWTVRALTRSGVLPSVRLSRRTIRYRPSVLDTLPETEAAA
jgi:excisionase family DNA binding protein